MNLKYLTQISTEMKIRLNSIFAILLTGCVALSASAQDYDDDDIYFNPSKAKSTTVKPNKNNYVVTDYPAADAYTPTGNGTNIDIDRYNRRGIFATDTISAADSLTDANFAYTRQIERFYNPDVVTATDDDELAAYYYGSQPTQVNINLNVPGYWGYPYAYYNSPWYRGSASSWWYYNSWAFNSLAWGWDPYWNWGWGPSWAWGPSWSWGWGYPHWGHHHHYYPVWGYHRPGSSGNVRPGYHPGHSTANGNYRPGYRPGASGNYRPSSNGTYRPGHNEGYRPGNNSGYRNNGRGSNRSSESHYGNPSNRSSNPSYRSSGNGNYRSSGTGYSGGSRGGSSRGGGGGRGRH